MDEWTTLANSYNAVVIEATIDSGVPSDNEGYGRVGTVFVVFALLFIIVGTIIGNILVCVAVCIVRKLRRPYNYLLVSLAVSDLCVAILVMPIALLYELLGKWQFGKAICDLWVSFDVLSCTASILNLCMISVDRYLAITRPLDYGVKRTPRRMIAYIAFVWLGAAFISVPPVLILGNEHGDGTRCEVCQNFWYQIYATLGSFYIPLTVMVTVYYKIFQAAKRIVNEEKRAQAHLRSTDEAKERDKTLSAPKPNMTSRYSIVEVSNGGIETRLGPEITLPEGDSSETGALLGSPRNPPASYNINNNSHSDVTPHRQLEVPSLQAKSTSSDMASCGSSWSISNVSQRGVLHSAVPPSTPIMTISSSNSRWAPSNGGCSSPRKRISRSRLRITLAKERKASTTLGIIMSAFIICWLPFFALAFIRPFLFMPSAIPASISSLFLWLGYANSLLNPIIYATLNKDFRKPFQEILCLRCSSLNHIMREEFYYSQYGPDTPNLSYAARTQRASTEYHHDEGKAHTESQF